MCFEGCSTPEPLRKLFSSKASFLEACGL
jgi:hypothetical protein